MNKKQKAIQHINTVLIPKLKRSIDQEIGSSHTNLTIWLIQDAMKENGISVDEIDYNSLGSEILKGMLENE